MLKKISFKQVCPTCHSFGIRLPNNKNINIAIICNYCHGKGYIENNIQYEKFVTRKTAKTIKRVFPENSPKINENDYERGMSYESWMNDKPFPENSEPRESCCPADWTRRTNPMYCPEWEKCEDWWDNKHWKQCDFFDKKEECWKQYDIEK